MELWKIESEFENIKKGCPFAETEEGWKDDKLDWTLDNCILLMILKKKFECEKEKCPAIKLFKAFGLL